MPIPQWRRRLVSQQLREGAVIAYPTEGVWGLGCMPDIPEAVERLLELKRRSWEKGLILVASHITQVEPLLGGITAAERAVLMATWPGPVTFLVPDNGVAPAWVRGRSAFVAIRVSAHPMIQAICGELGEPIVSTSANPTGKTPAITKLRLHQYFGQGVDLVIPGELGGLEGATEIRELRSGKVLRAVAGR